MDQNNSHDICRFYQSSSYNPLTGQYGECLGCYPDRFYHTELMKIVVSDPFKLASGPVLFELSKGYFYMEGLAETVNTFLAQFV